MGLPPVAVAWLEHVAVNVAEGVPGVPTPNSIDEFAIADNKQVQMWFDNSIND